MEQIAQNIVAFFEGIFGSNAIMESTIEIIIDVLFDVAKTAPILFVVYFLIEILQKKFANKQFTQTNMRKYGPLAGAVAGIVPQCGFSAAAATLYKNGAITAGTIIAVFIATSDEAIPLMLANTENIPSVLFLIAIKLIIAIAAGYIFSMTFYKNEKLFPCVNAKNHLDNQENIGCECCAHDHKSKSIWKTSLWHTLKISGYIVITLLVVQIAIMLIGKETMESLLLTSNPLQPVVAALFGIIPGCGTSVMITELFLQGSFSFGSCVAGLCTGAGFGFLILFKSKHHFKRNLGVLSCVFATAVITGSIIQTIEMFI